MSMKGRLATLTMMAAIMGGGLQPNQKPEFIGLTPPDNPIPKGCKRYYYNRHGLCSISESEIYFDAIKPSNAHEKYKKWKLKNDNN